MFEGINQNIPPPKRHKAAIINYIFKLQLILLPLFIVAGQNMKTPVCFGILMLEMGVIYTYIASRLTLKKKVFRNSLNLMSFLLLNALMSILAVLGLFLNEWHTEEYVNERQLDLKGKAIGSMLSYTIISMIALSILIEILRAVSLIYNRNKPRRYFKIRPKKSESRENRPKFTKIDKLEEDNLSEKTQNPNNLMSTLRKKIELLPPLTLRKASLMKFDSRRLRSSKK
jgi:hypothetical protein